MVGRNAGAEDSEDSSITNIGKLGWRLRHFVEKGRAFDVGGLGIPSIQITFGHLQSSPALVAFKNCAVLLPVHLRGYRPAHSLFHFLGRWPNIAEVHRLAISVVAQGLGGHIEI